MPPNLPDDVLHMIFDYLHQLRMRRTIVLIMRTGPSDIEDLPALISDGSGIMWDAFRAGPAGENEQPGWSHRVTEFCEKARLQWAQKKSDDV